MSSTNSGNINNTEELQYLQCIRDIDVRGFDEDGRNGSTRALFGYSMRFSLMQGQLPLLTTKKLAWKTCFRELMWFLRGSTSNTELSREGVHIWDANASRVFLDSRGLHTREEGDLGPIYGHQWRHFNAPYTTCHADYSGQGVDQLQYIIDQLKNPETRHSRRLVMSAWNPCQLDDMALPPCHILVQFNVRNNRYLSCALYQRSGDVGLGVPFNIASYAFLTHIIAKHCGLEAEEFVYFLGNAHIYSNHLEALREQTTREPYPFPRIEIRNVRDSIEEYTLDDLVFLEEYKCHPTIKMDMVA
jgi:thymidylate synthase